MSKKFIPSPAQLRDDDEFPAPSLSDSDIEQAIKDWKSDPPSKETTNMITPTIVPKNDDT